MNCCCAEIIFYDFVIIFFQDVDECDEGRDNCHDRAVCSNNIGSFSCSCAPGFSGDGIFACKGDFAFGRLVLFLFK